LVRSPSYFAFIRLLELIIRHVRLIMELQGDFPTLLHFQTVFAVISLRFVDPGVVPVNPPTDMIKVYLEGLVDSKTPRKEVHWI